MKPYAPPRLYVSTDQYVRTPRTSVRVPLVFVVSNRRRDVDTEDIAAMVSGLGCASSNGRTSNGGDEGGIDGGIVGDNTGGSDGGGVNGIHIRHSSGGGLGGGHS